MLHADGNARVTGFARVVVYGFWFAVVARTPVVPWADLPRMLFRAPGVLRWLPDAYWSLFLQAPVLAVFKVVLLTGCALVVAGVRPHTPVALATAGLLLLFDGTIQGFNWFLNHAQAAMLYAAIILAVFPAADGLSVLGPARRPARAALYAAPMLVVALVFCLAYAFIGTHRVAVGGAGIFTGDAIVTFLATTGAEPGRYGLLPTLYPALRPLFRLGFTVVTGFEILAPLALVSRRFRWLWLAVIVPFHLSTYFLMNILFWENLLLIAVFLTDLPAAVVRALPTRSRGDATTRPRGEASPRPNPLA